MIDSIIIIPILIEILIWIGIIGGLIWIWKKRNWTILKKVTITIIFAIGVIIAFFALFAYTLVSSDQANYISQGSNLGKINYDEVITNAKKAGYKIDVPTSANSIQGIGLHPSNIKELDDQFGEDYRFWSVGYFYNQELYFSTMKYQGYPDIMETEISFFKEAGTYAPFQPEDLPLDEWIIEKFILIFDINEQESRNYLAQLKDSIGKGPETKITIKKQVNVAAVYSNLKETSTFSNISFTNGDGWLKETFYKGDKKIGFLDIIIPNTGIIFQDKGREYTITIDRLGGVRPGIKLGAGENIPEEEYRGIFKKMFVNLGLPPEKVDEFKFEYNPSVW